MRGCFKGLALLLLTLTLTLGMSALADDDKIVLYNDWRTFEALGIVDECFQNALVTKNRTYLRGSEGSYEFNVGFATEINLYDCGITDLTGIEGFYNLVTLDCANNQLAALPSLEHNEHLTGLNCDGNPLTEVNASTLHRLESLSCNCENLRTLILPAVKTNLKMLYVSGSKLTALDLRGYSALTGFTCSGGALTSLNFSGCAALEMIWCTDTPLASLNVSGCDHLEGLYLDRCAFTTLSLANLPSLRTLKCTENASLTALELSACPALEGLECGDCQLTALTMPDCGAEDGLILSCPNNRLTALESIPTLVGLDCSNNRLTQLGSYPMLMELNCSNNQLTALSIPSDIWELDCSHNRLTQLDLTGRAGLVSVDCSHNQLTSLKIAGLEALYQLYAHGNALSTLDLSGTSMETASWAGDTTRDGIAVKIWNADGDLIFDTRTTLVSNGKVIYKGDGSAISIPPTPELVLPAGLIIIESDAFAGISATSVLIPASVQTIVGDPFAGSGVKTIYGAPGTAAEAFASRDDNPYTFVAVGD